jgi:hypothetical protein
MLQNGAGIAFGDPEVSGSEGDPTGTDTRFVKHGGGEVKQARPNENYFETSVAYKDFSDCCIKIDATDDCSYSRNLPGVRAVPELKSIVIYKALELRYS